MHAGKRLAGVALALVLVAFAGCRHAPDETRVREAISSAQEAARAAEPDGVVEAVSDDFDGNGGELGRKDLANLVRLARMRGAHLGVTLGPVSVERRGERLMADFTVSLSQGTQLLPDAAGVYQVETAWRKEGNKWRCYSATWKRQL